LASCTQTAHELCYLRHDTEHWLGNGTWLDPKTNPHAKTSKLCNSYFAGESYLELILTINYTLTL
jgi:hypothetical protein